MTTSLTDVYQIDHFIDTFAPGHYARVLEAIDRRTNQHIALKVLRSEHISSDGDIRWEYRAFPHEADLLMRLAGCPQVIDLYDCGYVETPDEAPGGGQVISLERDTRTFTRLMPEYAERGWRPYLALEVLPRARNLLYLMKPARPDVRWRLPTEEGLALAMQFAHVLKLAHSQNIVYLDHKLEHIYWDGIGLNIIDLNSSRLLENNAVDEQQFLMDVHNLTVGILYPIFTGLSPQKNALRPQPGGLSEMEDRYREIQQLDFGVEPSLSVELQNLLQRGASMQISTIDQFITELSQVCALHGWDFPKQTTRAVDRLARDHMRGGLRQLREGQEALREARDLFRDAAILDGISPDLEEELRRLIKAVGDTLNHRVIP